MPTKKPKKTCLVCKKGKLEKIPTRDFSGYAEPRRFDPLPTLGISTCQPQTRTVWYACTESKSCGVVYRRSETFTPEEDDGK